MGRHDTEIGHHENWPRRLARKHPSLPAALEAMDASTDEANERFAWPEFINERERMALAAERERLLPLLKRCEVRLLVLLDGETYDPILADLRRELGRESR